MNFPNPENKVRNFVAKWFLTFREDALNKSCVSAYSEEVSATFFPKQLLRLCQPNVLQLAFIICKGCRFSGFYLVLGGVVCLFLGHLTCYFVKRCD